MSTMNRGDDLLRQACAQLAQEEAEQLEAGLSRAQIRQAEEAYRRHRLRALRTIARRTKKPLSSSRVFLRVAAAAVVSTSGGLDANTEKMMQASTMTAPSMQTPA